MLILLALLPLQDLSPRQVVIPDPPGALDVSASALADFDGDGDLDLVVGRAPSTVGSSGHDIEVYRNDGNGDLTGPEAFFPLPNLGQAPWILDINGDGIVDVFQQRNFVPARLSIGTGSGFAPAVEVDDVVLRKFLLRFADADGDGDLDIFQQRTSFGPLEFIENLIGTSFAAPVVVLHEPGDTGATSDYADVNGDGAVDRVSVRQYSSFGLTFRDVIYFLGDPAAPGRFGPQVTLSSLGEPQNPRFVDIDSDGFLDIHAVPNGALNDGFRQTWFGDGTGAFDGAGGYGSAPAMNTVPSLFVDFDGDGFVDVLSWREVTAIDYEPVVAFGDGTGTFGAPIGGPDSPRFASATAGDLDGDGDMDLAFLITAGLSTFESMSELGTPLCPGTANSSGAAAELVATGSPLAPNPLLPAGRAVLTVEGVPQGQTVLFVNGTATASLPGAGGSQGTLCLGGALSRYVGPGEIQFAGAGGRARLRLDLAAMPVANVLSTVTSGQTLHFQAWYRDLNPGPVSNFSSAVSLTFL